MSVKIKGFKKVGKAMLWTLEELSWSAKSRTLYALLLGYESEQSYDDGEAPFTSELHSWVGDEFEAFDITKALDKQVEDAILLREDWIGATVTDKVK